jgi:phosphoketolase
MTMRSPCRHPAPSRARIRWSWDKFPRDVARLNQDQRNFRISGSDETLSNLQGAVFEVTNRE